MKKFFPLLLGIAAVIAGYILLQQKNQPTAHTQNNQEIATITVVAPWEINSTDPSKAGTIFQRMQLAETLIESNEKGELIAGLATHWESNEDASRWIFTLRDNVLFHNGQPLTAQTVANSLKHAIAKPGLLQKAFIKEIEALNDKQLQITLTKPFVPFPTFLTHYSAIILADQAYNAAGDVISIIGTGPYQVSKIEPPQKVEATRFAQYWGKKPKVQQANYLASSRSETRMLMAQSDESALVFNLDPASVERIKTDPNLTLNTESIARTIQLKLNLAKPFLNDLAIRKALSAAIDRKAIAESVLKIDNGMANQILPKAFSDWRISADNHAPDIAKIKQDLTASGYKFDEKGNLLDQSGTPFRLTLLTFPDRPELPLIATILQAQWKQLGIDVKVSVGNFSEIPAGHQDGSLEIALYARNYGTIPDPLGVILQDFANNGGDWGVMNWRNAQLDSALQQLESERDPQQAVKLKQHISQIIYDELPIIPVVYYQQNAVSHKNINGVTLDPFERRFFLENLHK